MTGKGSGPETPWRETLSSVLDGSKGYLENINLVINNSLLSCPPASYNITTQGIFEGKVSKL